MLKIPSPRALAGAAAKLCASIAAAVVDRIPEILLLGGSAAVTVGAGQVARPAGWIVGGAFALVWGWRLQRGSMIESQRTERADRG